VFAYRVPMNPYAPRVGDWATLVRRDRVRVGDVLDERSWTESSGEVRTVGGSPDRWEVAAVELIGNEGTPAPVRRKLAPEAVWAGALVLRLVR
jgi:hypothetical protein